jgi:hypothetical protein
MGVMPAQRLGAPLVLQENVGTEWAVRSKSVPICYTFSTPPVQITGASDLACWRQSYSSMPKPAAAICWKVAPLIHSDSAFCSFSRAWSCAGRELWSPPPRSPREGHCG